MAGNLPSNLQQFFEDQVAALPPASTCVLVIDPEAFLDLGHEYVDFGGRKWRVYRYRADDLRFRVEYAAKPDDPNFAHIIWAGYPPVRKGHTINLSYIPDIVDSADGVIDVSVPGALRVLAPRETWQSDTLALHSATIAANLATFLQSHRSLRKLLGKGTALGAHHIALLTLTCLQTSLDVVDLLFEQTAPEELLKKYLQLLWLHDWQDEGLATLRTVVREGSRLDLSSLSTWLDGDPRELAKLTYLWSVLKRFEVPNPLNQLRGLGLITVEDSPSLTQSIGLVADALLEDRPVAARVEQIAEEQISRDDLHGLLDLLDLASAESLMAALLSQASPALLFGFATRYLQVALEEGAISDHLATCDLDLIAHPPQGGVTTGYAALALNLIQALLALSRVEKELAVPFRPHAELSSVLTWYTEKSQLASLKMYLAEAARCLRATGETSLAQLSAPYMQDLERRVSDRLQMADENLADLIGKNWQGYASNPRLSINVLRDTILKKRIRPAKNSRVWILVFDGMRWDTWHEVIKPALTEHFQVMDEKVYLCVLPSTTNFARTSLLAGNVPRYWTDHRGDHITDHTVLAAKLFGLPSGQHSQLLRVTVAAGTDFSQRRLDLDVRPYNVLIYNLSDDWIHTFRYDVSELNKTIARMIEEVILPDLLGRIQDQDTVVITSDHGFIELSPGDGLTVRAKKEWTDFAEDDPRNPVTYRYLRNLQHESGLEVRWEPSEFYTLAVGKTWFRREKKGRFSRYAHGGISLSEMVVPGVLCKRITAPTVDIVLEQVPGEIDLVEDEHRNITVTLANRGNRKGEFSLSAQVSSGRPQTTPGTLGPGEQIQIHMPVLASSDTTHISWELSYTTLSGEIKRLPKRRTSVRVTLRRDKVELDLSALDKLDDQ